MNPEDGATPEFPSEIIIEIFLRLPVKSLCRFKCASKPWQSLISSPSFARTHLNHNKRNEEQQIERLFSISRDHNCYSLDLESSDSKATQMRFRDGKMIAIKMIWNSCGGLILFTDLCWSLFLVNPSTGECRELPPSPFSIDYVASEDYYGLGYDTSVDDYKVVRISHYYLECYVVASVYNLRTNSWRRIESSQKLLIWDDRSVAFLNGVLHWVGKTEVISFDLATESFHGLPFPYSGGEIVQLGLLNVLGGCLFGIEYDFDFEYVIEFDVWVMKEYSVKDSWVRFRVSHGLFRCVIPSMCGKLLLGKGNRLTFYDLATGEAVELTARGVRDSDIDWTIYEESLVRLQE